jgi:hypothetical protein
MPCAPHDASAFSSFFSRFADWICKHKLPSFEAMRLQMHGAQLAAGGA